MRILGIIASERRNGNSELAVKYIAKKLNAELEILRLTKMEVKPCKACYACLYGEECKIDDDVYAILEKIGKSDAVIISSPVYFLDATGKFKALLDRGFLALPNLESFSKKCVVLTHHGFKEMKGWASATHLMLARAFGFNVLANLELHAALPGEVLAKDENLKKLNIAVESIKSGERYVGDNQCPICLNNVFRVEEGGIVCPLCGSEFDRNLNVLREGRMFSEEWFSTHFNKLKNLKEEYKRRKDDLEEIKRELENNICEKEIQRGVKKGI